jgi:large subunit ribosomal protein L23
MRSAEDIILRPYITEKSNDGLSEGKYTFIVAPDATKTEVKYAVEKLFQVKVLKVNTSSYEGKVKRMGVHQGPRPSWKKAVVKIDLEPAGPKEKYVRVPEKVQKLDKDGKPVVDKNGQPLWLSKR